MTRFGRNVFSLTAAMAAAVSLMVAQGPAGGWWWQRWRQRTSGSASHGEGAGAHRPHWLLGFAGDGRLVVSHGDSGQGRPRQCGCVERAGYTGGRAAANAWDPAKDEAAGQQCKAYGAAGLMRVPGRLNIDWQDDNTLRIQTDAGTQTRLMRFTGDVSGAPSLQGFSKATWDGLAGRGRGTFEPLRARPVMGTQLVDGRPGRHSSWCDEGGYDQPDGRLSA